MALGDQYNNNKSKNNNNVTLYGQYKFSNKDSKVDATALNSTFWNNTLKLSITPIVEEVDESGNTVVKYDHDSEVAIYLNHTKARLLYGEICEYLNDPHKYNNLGVDSGARIITISNGKEFGVNSTFIIIRKLNMQSSEVEASAAYEIKNAYHYSIRNYDEKEVSLDKVYYDTLELEQIKDLLKSYYEAMTGAFAYSVLEASKYDNSRVNTKLGLVMEKLGIETLGKNKSQGGKSSGSIFANKEGRTYSSSTLDDIENQY